jgi:O-antigen ligase
VSPRFRRGLIINSPSVILLAWAFLLAAGLTGTVLVRVALMLILAIAFVAEERVKWADRRRRKREQDESGSE